VFHSTQTVDQVIGMTQQKQQQGEEEEEGVVYADLYPLIHQAV
jgi:hypothetical protein